MTTRDTASPMASLDLLRHERFGGGDKDHLTFGEPCIDCIRLGVMMDV